MDDYGDPRFGYSNWLDGAPAHTSQPSANDLAADYDQVEPGFACPNCGEDCNDDLINVDDHIHCATCGADYEV